MLDLRTGQKATIVVDLGFGDSGKGTIVDYLARQVHQPTVVRFNGGAQAAHNVVTPDGRHHTFAQFGAGTFAGARTHLSRYMLLDPLALMTEAAHLQELGEHDVLERLSIDAFAKVVTPFQKAANRIREYLRGGGKHGSCGMGVGETMADAIAFASHTILVGDMLQPLVLREKLAFVQKLKYDEFVHELSRVDTAMLGHEVRLLRDPNAPEICVRAFERVASQVRIVSPDALAQMALHGELIFEGAQGVLLDEWHGFHPYTTWSTTTADNAQTLLHEIGFAGTVTTTGVLRTYFTRHGAGPFPTEDPESFRHVPEKHNGTGLWQGAFRKGWFDAVLARYALSVSPVDSLALTHVDAMQHLRYGVRICSAYTAPDLSPQENGAVVFKNGRIHTLKPKRLLTDLQYQETLTRILQKSDQAYEDVTDIVHSIERALRVPVSLVSSGPTALHKHPRSTKGLIAA